MQCRMCGDMKSINRKSVNPKTGFAYCDDTKACNLRLFPKHDFYGPQPNPPCRFCGTRYSLETKDQTCKEARK